MPRLTLRLLGPLSALRDDRESVSFAYDKVRALCAFLASEPARVHPRTRLAALLWPEKSESAARHSLSQALSSLRDSFGDRAGNSPLIHADRQNVWFNPDADYTVDVVEFQRLIERAASAPGDEPAQPVSSVAALRRAVALYRGPFLEGLYLDDCPEFEAWQRTMQEANSRLCTSALKSLSQQLELRGDFVDACTWADRLIELDPWDEESHRLQIRLLAARGHRAAALRNYERCVELLERELGLKPEPETVELAERIRSGLEGPVQGVTRPQTVPRPRPAPALPVSSTSIIGRDTEIEEICEQLRSCESRLVTLIGPGGIGKSRLALEVLRSLSDEMADGVYFVPLAGVQSPDLLASAILDTTSGQVDPHGDRSDQLRAFVQKREMLFLLDNFEHLLDGALLVNELLETSPGLRILVTSRERLSLTSESVYQVKGLSLPDRADLPAIATSGATRLFKERARKHQASFLPRDKDAPAIARIAHLTGGMPLALELAAAWIPVLSPGEIAEEIAQSLDFLSTSMRDLPERHRSVRAVVERSWERLAEVDQRTFRRLSVFQGGFTRHAANYVTGASLVALSSLVSKSFLRLTDEGRYEIHELLRQYGEQQLDDNPAEASVVRDRFRDYYIGFVAVREEQLRSGAQARVLNEIAGEMVNVRAAWGRAIETRDIRGLSRAAPSLWLYFDITDRYSEGTSMMQAAHTALETLADMPVPDAEDYALAIARLRSRGAALDFRLSGPSAMQEQIQEALDVVRPLGEPSEVGLLLNFMACGAHVREDYEQEEAYLQESIEKFEQAGDRWGIAYSKNDLGQLWTLRGDYFAARELHQTALAILEELGDQRGIAFALRNLGIAESYLGNSELALQLIQRSIDARQPIGNQWGTAESLNQIGIILRKRGQVLEAEKHFREALRIAREIRAMQLAAEILREYLPLVDSSTGTDAGTLSQSPSEPAHTGTLSSRSDVSEIAIIVDSVLGVYTDEVPRTSDAIEQ